MSTKSKNTGLELQLSGQDSNAFHIIGRARGVLHRSGIDNWLEIFDEFQKEATSGDYDHVIQTCMEYFDVV